MDSRESNSKDPNQSDQAGEPQSTPEASSNPEASSENPKAPIPVMQEMAARAARHASRVDGERVSVDVLECPICGGKHTELQATKYTSPFGEFTHWYQCPTTGGPVPFHITASEDSQGAVPGNEAQGDEMQAKNEAMELIHQAFDSGKWFLSIHWHDQSDHDQSGAVQHRNITSHFLFRDFSSSLKSMQAYIEGELQPVEMPVPKKWEMPVRTGMPNSMPKPGDHQ